MKRLLTWTLATIPAAVLLLAACGSGETDGPDNSGATDTPNKVGDVFESRGEPAPYALASDSDDGASPGVDGEARSSILGRKLVFSATLELEAEDVDSSYRSVAGLAQELGGFVAQSDFSLRTSSDGEPREYATVVIRVPAEQYTSAVDRLRRLDGVTVMREESRTTEVTEEYVDIQSRLRNLERTEGRYLELLDDAKSVQDILAVSDRLDSVRLQIEQLEGRLQALDDLVDMASISITLAPVLPAAAGAGTDGPASFGDAFSEAWDWALERLEYLVAGLGYAVVAAIWIGVPLALVLGAMRVTRRSRTGQAS